MRLCAIIPTYDNPTTLAEQVRRVREHITEALRERRYRAVPLPGSVSGKETASAAAT